MKYVCYFILSIVTIWNSWGKEFVCIGERARYEQLKWDVQNLSIDPEFDASIRLSLFYCQMTYKEDLAGAFQNLKDSADLGNIKANFTLAEYYLTGGWGENPSVQSRDKAIWEFEKTLNKINGAGTDYPNTAPMAEREILYVIYPNTLGHLIMKYTNKYIKEEEGLLYYENKNPAHYNDPAAILARSDRVNIYMLNPLEHHIKSCLADDRGQAIPGWAKRFRDYIPTFEEDLIGYNAYYTKLKEGYCPLFKRLLDEIRKREANMQKIALNCTPPSEQATAERPPCTNIKTEVQAFRTFLNGVIEEFKVIKSG